MQLLSFRAGPGISLLDLLAKYRDYGTQAVRKAVKQPQTWQGLSLMVVSRAVITIIHAIFGLVADGLGFFSRLEEARWRGTCSHSFPDKSELRV